MPKYVLDLPHVIVEGQGISTGKISEDDKQFPCIDWFCGIRFWKTQLMKTILIQDYHHLDLVANFSQIDRLIGNQYWLGNYLK